MGIDEAREGAEIEIVQFVRRLIFSRVQEPAARHPTNSAVGPSSRFLENLLAPRGGVRKESRLAQPASPVNAKRLSETANRVRFVLMDVEHGVQLRNLQKVFTRLVKPSNSACRPDLQPK